MAIKEQQEQYRDQGYFIVDDMVESAVLDSLEAAARRVRDKVHSGAVDVANCGREATAIFGLLAPEFGESVFAEYLITPAIIDYAEAFLGGELRLGYVHLWSCTREGSYDTGWHRDLGGQDRGASEEEELALLNQPKVGLKWQLALVDDPFLWLVPGSHRRYRSEEERQCLTETRHADISGQQLVALRRGQTIFWNGNAIHRGHVPADAGERLTVTGGLIKYREDEEAEAVDERFRWRLADNIRGTLPAKVQLYYDRWRALQIA